MRISLVPLTCLAVLAAAMPSAPAFSADRPNILWLTAEDLSPHLGCYGDDFAVTPHLDALARQGVRYTAAFATAPVCTPARSCIITGVYASSLGSQHLRGEITLPEKIRCFSELLREAGYYCTNNVKEDYNFRAPPTAWDESSTKAHWRNRPRKDQPFFAVFNFMTTHQSRIRFSEEEFAALTARLSPEERRDPHQVPLPPYYPDTPVVRRDLARLYDLTCAMDKEVADLLAQLEEDGLADNTIVFFYSDHGDGMPRHKRWLYDAGLRVPLIVRFPERYRRWAPAAPGGTCDRLVTFADLAPTVLGLAGLDVPAYMQGRAFLGPHVGEPWEYVFGTIDRVDEVYEMSRTVRDARYRYIRNYLPHRPPMQYSTFSEITPTRQELRRLKAAGELRGAAAQFMSDRKPIEELYDTQADPHEIHNLAGLPEHRETLRRLRHQLRAWMVQSHDTGLLPEPEMHRRAGDDAIYDMARDPQRFPAGRILAAAEMVGRGAALRERLVAHLAADDAAIRWWAAQGLLALGEEARPAADALAARLDDASPAVRFAAAEALCGLGRADTAIPALADGLAIAEPRTRLLAAIHLAAVGGQARPALGTIRETAAAMGDDDFGMFTRWALEISLRQLEAAPR